MVMIELRGGYGEIFEKNVFLFKRLCKKLEIQELIVGESFKNDKCIYAVSPTMIICLYTGEKIYNLILEDFKKDFKILECDSFKTGIREHLELLENSLDRIEDIVKKRNLVECPACKRSTDISNFCPYCGKELDINVKLCDACQMVYVPAYRYCPACGAGLKEMPYEIFGFRDPEEFYWGVDKDCIVEENQAKET